MSLYQSFKKLQKGWVMIAVAIFGLVTFSITSPMLMTFAPDPRKAEDLTITLPSGKTRTLVEQDRLMAGAVVTLFYPSDMSSGLLGLAQRIPNANKLQMKLFEFLFEGLGGDPTAKQKGSEVRQVMLLTALANDAGIEVGHREIEEWLAGAFDSAEVYRVICNRFNLTAPQFESALRDALLVRRLMTILRAQTPLPSGDELVKAWCEKNEAYTFEVAAFSAEDLRKSIDPASIPDAELKTWFDGLKDFDKGKYRQPEKVKLEGIAILDPSKAQSEAFEALVAASDLVADYERTYYELTKAERFKKAPAASAPASMPETSPAFEEFDAVKTRALREARVARALEKVKEEAEKAKSEPGFDLSKLAEKYGLLYWQMDAKPIFEVNTFPTYGSESLVRALSGAAEGQLLAGYQATPSALEITRVVQRSSARTPEVAEIKDKVLPDYIEAKSGEKAKDAARAFVEALAAESGDDRFEKTAQAKGIELKILSPLRKNRREDPDFHTANPKDRDKDPAYALALLSGRGAGGRGGARVDPFEIKKGEFGGPYDNPAAKTEYVVKLVEKKEPTIADMSAVDYAGTRDALIAELRRKKTQEMIGSDALSKQLKIKEPGAPKAEPGS